LKVNFREEKLDATAATTTEITNIIRYIDQEFGGRWDDGCTEGVAEDPLGSFFGYQLGLGSFSF